MIVNMPNRSFLLFACILSFSLVDLSQNPGREQVAPDTWKLVVETPDQFDWILVL